MASRFERASSLTLLIAILSWSLLWVPIAFAAGDSLVTVENIRNMEQNGLKPGILRISRSGTDSIAETVYLHFSGTAVLGEIQGDPTNGYYDPPETDYYLGPELHRIGQTPIATATIPAGSRDVEVQYMPVVPISPPEHRTIKVEPLSTGRAERILRAYREAEKTSHKVIAKVTKKSDPGGNPFIVQVSRPNADSSPLEVRLYFRISPSEPYKINPPLVFNRITIPAGQRFVEVHFEPLGAPAVQSREMSISAVPIIHVVEDAFSETTTRPDHP